MRLKGFTRQGSAVVNTDTSDLDAIKARRAQKKQTDQVSGEVRQLRELVMDLKKRLEVLERG